MEIHSLSWRAIPHWAACGSGHLSVWADLPPCCPGSLVSWSVHPCSFLLLQAAGDVLPRCLAVFCCEANQLATEHFWSGGHGHQIRLPRSALHFYHSHRPHRRASNNTTCSIVSHVAWRHNSWSWWSFGASFDTHLRSLLCWTDIIWCYCLAEMMLGPPKQKDGHGCTFWGCPNSRRGKHCTTLGAIL